MRPLKGSRLCLTLIAVSLVVGVLALPENAPAAPRLAKVEARVTRAAATLGADASLDLVASLDKVATPALADRLARLGSWSWTFRHVPVAAVRLPVRRLEELRRVAGVRGIYLNSRLEWMLKESAHQLDIETAWRDLKLTGKGVTVAVVDSGIDFLHPDLAPAMKASVKLVGFGAPVPAVPIEDVPDTDNTAGHGTHVAGGVAGRGTMSNGDYKGMAYGADLVGIGAGDVLFLFTAVEGLDYVLQRKAELGIKIVNNSWGEDFEPFDPDNPVNVATKALADAGVLVVFAVGDGTDEMTMTQFAAAPWVLPVGGGTKDGSIEAASSGGMELDASGLAFDGTPVPGAWRPLGVGEYHPSVVATGEGVISTRAPGTVYPATSAAADLTTLPPALLPYYTILSGTSMAAPQIAGVAALLLEANPALTPAQIRSILELTARPIADTPFWKQGYGYADASAAAVLALSLRGKTAAAVTEELARRHTELDARLIGAASGPGQVWAWNDEAPLGPLSVSHTFAVPAGAGRVKVVTNGPATPQVNLAGYALALTDAAGESVGTVATVTSAQSANSGTTVLDVNLHSLGADQAASDARYKGLHWGTWTVSIDAVSPGIPVSSALTPNKATIATAAGAFATAAAPTCGLLAALAAVKPISYRLQDDSSTGVPWVGDPSYTYIGPVVDGTLGTRTPRNLAGTFGAATTVLAPVGFATAPFDAPVTIGQAAVLQIWVEGVAGQLRGSVEGQLFDIAPDGSEKEVTASVTVPMEASAPAPARTTMTIPLAHPVTFGKGHRLAVNLTVLYAPTAGSTLLYDSDEFPSGLTVIPVVTTPIKPCFTPPKLPIVGGASGRRLPATGVGQGLLGLVALGTAGVLSMRTRAISRRR